jgi:O-antigen/teichoic acid export membrane protein
VTGSEEPLAGESIARNTLFSLLTQVTTALFTAVLTIYLARALGPEDFGVFALALAIGGVLLLPADFGIASSAARFIAERRQSPAAVADVFRTAARLRLVTSGIVCTTMALAAGPVANAYDEPDLAWAVRGMALALFGQTAMGLYQGSLTALRRTSLNLQIVLSKSVVELVASVAIVAAGAGAAGAAFGRAAGYLTAAAVGLVLLLRLLRRSSGDEYGGPRIGRRALGGYALAMAVIEGAFALFGQVDVLIIGAISGAAAAGLFQAPLRLVSFLHYPGNALAAGIAPRMARGPGHEPELEAFQTGLRYLIVLQAWIVVPVLVWAEPMVDLVLGDDYAESAEVLRALAPFIFLLGLGPLASLAVNYLGEARRRVPIAIVTVVVNIAIDLILIPEIGIVGGAVGTDVAYAIYVPAHLWVCHKLVGLPLGPLATALGRTVPAAAAMAGVLALFGTGDVAIPLLFAGAVLGTLTFAAGVFATGAIGRDEATELLRRLRPAR